MPAALTSSPALPFDPAGPFPSGKVLAAMRTSPAASTIALQATRMGVPADVVDAAVGALRSGEVVAAVVSGKLASGKDTIAERVAEILPEWGLRPGVVHQTSAPMRAEYRRIIELVASTSTVAAAAAAVTEQMGVPYAAADHMALTLFDVTRDPTALPDPDARTDLNRHMLVFHADEGRRSIDPEYWTHQFFQSVCRSLAEGRSVLLTGCRHPNEIGPAQALGLATVRLMVSRSVQEQRLWGRDGLDPDPAALDNPNECALDDYIGFNLMVGNDDALEPTVATVLEHLADHAARLAA